MTMKRINFTMAMALIALATLILLCCPITKFNIFAGFLCLGAGGFNLWLYLRK